MSTKELIRADLDRLNESDLEEVYRVVRDFINRAQAPEKKPGLLAQLQGIRIDASEDFSKNILLHRRGEKSLDDIR
jgi:hypothetical protein